MTQEEADIVIEEYTPSNWANCKGCAYEDYDMDESPCCTCNRQVVLRDNYEVIHPADK